MNKLALLGRLTKDAEIRYTQGAEPLAVVKFTIAVNRKIRKENENEADFINCVAFGKRAEFISKYFSKGKMIAVSGELRSNSWSDENGNKRYSLEVLCLDVDFCGDFNKEKQNDADIVNEGVV